MCPLQASFCNFQFSRGYIYSGVIKPKLPNLVSTGKANSKIMYYCNADRKDCFNLHVLFTDAVNLNINRKRKLAIFIDKLLAFNHYHK